MKKDVKPEYKELLRILGCFVRQEKYTSSNDFDCVLLRRLAEQHSISGIVGYILRKGMDDWAQVYYSTCGETIKRLDAFNELEAHHHVWYTAFNEVCF